jgi:hydroxypyruvate isomerase
MHNTMCEQDGRRRVGDTAKEAKRAGMAVELERQSNGRWAAGECGAFLCILQEKRATGANIRAAVHYAISLFAFGKRIVTNDFLPTFSPTICLG